MSVDWHFVIALYIANCVAQSMPNPSGRNELYLFVYRLFHLLLLNIGNIIQTAIPPKTKMLDVSGALPLHTGSETAHTSTVLTTEEK